MTALMSQPWQFVFARILEDGIGRIVEYGQSLAANKKLMKRLAITMCVAIFATAAFSWAGDPMGTSDAEAVADAAASAPPYTPLKKSFSSEKLANDIATAFDKTVEGLTKNADIKSAGARLAGIAVLVMMVWGAMKCLLGGKGIGEVIGEWVPVLIAFAVVTAILDQGVGEQIVSFMNSVASSISGGIQVDSAKSLVPSVIKKVFGSVTQIAEMPLTTDTGWGGAALAAMLLAGVLKLATIVVVLLAGCVYLAIALMSMVSVALVLALAPLLVPFLIFTPLSWLFDGWLRFLLGACMMKIVGAFMLNLTSAILTQMTVVAKLAAADSTGSGLSQMASDPLLYGCLLFLAVLSALLMAQVPAIATGLLQGSAAGAGFKGLAGVTQSAGGRATAAAAGLVGSGAVSGYQRTVGAAMAAQQGKYDAMNGISPKAMKYQNAHQHRAYVMAHGREANKDKPAPPPPPPPRQPSINDVR